MDKIKQICERNKKPSLQNIISGEDRYTLDISDVMKEISIEFLNFVDKSFHKGHSGIWINKKTKEWFSIKELFEKFNNSENK